MRRSAFWLALPLVLVGCSEYRLGGDENPNDTHDTDAIDYTDAWDDIQCQSAVVPDENVGVTDLCDFAIGGFEPVVSWQAGEGMHSHAQPAVADLDHDGTPEIVTVFETELIAKDSITWGSTGQLVALRSDGSTLWTAADAEIGSGSSPAVADLDGDGWAEIVAVRQVEGHGIFDCSSGDFRVVAWDYEGHELWESVGFQADDFDQSAAVTVADMDGDGSPEIIAGRVIFRADGSVRGVGTHGHGSYGIAAIPFFGEVCETSVPAVVDLDLDGQMEVIVGDAMYDADGNDLWYDAGAEDGMISVANLDDDPEGEYVAILHDTILARDTDGSLLWGPFPVGLVDPMTGESDGNILAVAAIQDLDNDGSPEIVTAGGSELVAFHADGTRFWSVSDLGGNHIIKDDTGATGASFFDFEGDGKIEVVYIDEAQLVAVDGQTGALKFWSGNHSSNTLFDYPTIADIDADGHADILVSHWGYGNALSAYRDATNSWAPARRVHNQHQYSVTNIYDDLTVPTDTTPNFTSLNSWHSAVQTGLSGSLVMDLAAEIVGTCSDDCDAGAFHLVGRVLNLGVDTVGAGIPVTLYARIGGDEVALDTLTTALPINSGMTGEPLEFDVPPSALDGADRLTLSVDDSGHGGGLYTECSEDNNRDTLAAPFCE